MQFSPVCSIKTTKSGRTRDVQGVITRAELLKLMRASLKHEGYDQIPQLECPAAAKKKKLLE